MLTFYNLLQDHPELLALGCLFLGIGVTVVQYLWDFAGRAAVPKLADSSLALYLIVAIVLCSIFLVRDNFRQMKLCQASSAADSGSAPLHDLH